MPGISTAARRRAWAIDDLQIPAADILPKTHVTIRSYDLLSPSIQMQCNQQLPDHSLNFWPSQI